MNGVVVTGTDTDVGKTVVSAALMRAVAQRHPDVRVVYWKLVQTGWPAHDDGRTVRRLAGLRSDQVEPPLVKLALPASPYEAALSERVRIPPSVRAPRPSLPDGEVRVVEGAGGLLVPLTEQWLLVDSFAALSLPTLLVARPDVGTINHTLLSVAELERRGLPCLGVIFSGAPTKPVERIVRRRANLPFLIALPRLPRLTPQTLAEQTSALLRRRLFARLIDRIVETP